MTIATKMPTASNAATSAASLSMTAAGSRTSSSSLNKTKTDAQPRVSSKKPLPNLNDTTSSAYMNDSGLSTSQSRAPLLKIPVDNQQPITLSKRKLTKLRTPLGMETLNESAKEEESDEEVKAAGGRNDQEASSKPTTDAAETTSAIPSPVKEESPKPLPTATTSQEPPKKPASFLKPIKKRAKSLNKKPTDQHHNSQSPQSQSTSSSHTPSFSMTSSSMTSGTSSSYQVHSTTNYEETAHHHHLGGHEGEGAENEDDFKHFDLYRPETNIVYIKQKYKMYLDWLNENCLKSSISAPQQQQQQQPSQNHQLNWYNYEKSVFENNDSINTKNYYKFLNALLANNSSSKGAASAKAVRAKLSQQAMLDKADPQPPHNPQSFFQQQKSKSSLVKNNPGKYSIDLRSSNPKTEPPSSKQPILIQRPSPTQLSPIDPSQSSRKALIELKINTANKSLRANKDLESVSEDLASSVPSKGVKFEPNHETLSSAKLNNAAATSNNKRNNNNSTILHFNSSVTSSKASTSTSSMPETRLNGIKPILKSSHSNNSSNDYYYTSKTNGDPFAAVRHNSIGSVGSNGSSSYKVPPHHFEMNSSTTISSLGSNKNATGSGSKIGTNAMFASMPLKLPPITNCSDVFYSVLYDMEKNTS